MSVSQKHPIKPYQIMASRALLSFIVVNFTGNVLGKGLVLALGSVYATVNIFSITYIIAYYGEVINFSPLNFSFE